MGLESVGDLALNTILTKLGPKETAKVSCVSKKFKDLAAEESLWSLFCRQDLDLSAPLDHHGNPLPSFKVIYNKFNYINHPSFLLVFLYMINFGEVWSFIVSICSQSLRKIC